MVGSTGSSRRALRRAVPLAALVGLMAGGGGCGDASSGLGPTDAAGLGNVTSRRDGGDSVSLPDGGAATKPTPTPTACGAETSHSGDGTYYDADGSGNCMFPATPADLDVGAMNQSDYADSAACGRCAHVQGPDGELTIRIVDRCPECKPGDIDLSPSAFSKLAALSRGRVPIQWTYVPCEVSGNVSYHFKDGSNPWWTGVQVRNHRHGISRFEYKNAQGAWVQAPRENFNYFVDGSGMGPGPYSFRITDVYGGVIEDHDIVLGDDVDRQGSAQFAGCGRP